MASEAPEVSRVRGRESKLLPRVAALQNGMLEDMAATIGEWRLCFSGKTVVGLSAQLRDMRARVEWLAGTLDEAMRNLALDTFDRGMRREFQEPGGRALMECLFGQILRSQATGDVPSLTLAGARVWVTSPPLTARLACRRCGFVVPAREGSYDYQLRRRGPMEPCVAACTECGGEFGDDDGDG